MNDGTRFSATISVLEKERSVIVKIVSSGMNEISLKKIALIFNVLFARP